MSDSDPVRELADRLIGTCESVDPAEELDTDDYETLLRFDGMCFCCATCGWWHGTDQLSDNNGVSGQDLICDECDREERGED